MRTGPSAPAPADEADTFMTGPARPPPPLEVLDARLHVGRRVDRGRPGLSNRFGNRGVLLQHVPAAIAPLFERPDGTGNVDTATAEGLEQPGTGRFEQRGLMVPDRGGQRHVDVLQMDQPHPGRVVGGECDRVDAPIEKWPVSRQNWTSERWRT